MKNKGTVVKVLTLFLFVCLFLILNGGTAEAKVPKMTKKGIQVNETNFPKKKVRERIKKKYDFNGNGYISKQNCLKSKY